MQEKASEILILYSKDTDLAMNKMIEWSVNQMFHYRRP